MIRLTATGILRYLLENFDFIELLYKIRRDDDSISGEAFQKVITEKGFNENKIYEYRILKPISNGDLIFNPHYKKFIEFLLKETSLNLPEKWANQTQLINESFTKLQVTTNKQEIKFYIRELRNTIDEFVTDIQDNLAQLLKDTEAVKAWDKDTDELTKRILKAKDWINFFVKPLNDILDKNQTQSIINSINQLMRYSNDRKYEEDDYEISQLYNYLYFFIDNANKELDVIIKHLVNELIPLLRKIEGDSLILSGFIHFLKNPFKPDELPVPLIILPTRRKNFIYSQTFANDASLYLDQFNNKQTYFFEDEKPDIDDWIPDSEHYKELLKKQLPVTDFYQWCFEQLKEETQNINVVKFISLANIIHEKEFYAEFQPNQNFTIELEDAFITLPKVKLYASIS